VVQAGRLGLGRLPCFCFSLYRLVASFLLRLRANSWPGRAVMRAGLIWPERLLVGWSKTIPSSSSSVYIAASSPSSLVVMAWSKGVRVELRTTAITCRLVCLRSVSCRIFPVAGRTGSWSDPMFTDICQSRKIWASRTSFCSRRGNLMRAIRETRTNRTRCSLMHGVRRIWASQTRYRSRRTGMMHGTREGGWIMFSHSSDPSGEKKYSLGPGAVLGEVRDEGRKLDQV
jgi:hypothetical protein